MRLSRRRGQVTHVLLTRSPLIQNQQKPVPSPFDLHVLSTPPAFVLSQDQTLQTKPTKFKPQPTTNSQPEPKVSTTVQKTRPGPTQPQNKGQANQNKTNPKNHTQQTKVHYAQPPGPWHKKHDTLSSSQTTHPPRFKIRKSSLLASRRRPD